MRFVIFTVNSAGISSCVVVLDRCPFPDDAYDEDELNASDVNRNACASSEIVSGDLPITPSSDPTLEILRCDKCQYQTKIASLYRNHIAKHSQDLNFKCPSCDFSDASNNEFVEHLATHQTGNVLQCNFCAKKFRKSLMKQHMLIHRATELYDCSVCEFSTNYARTIKNHTEAFHVKELKCNECDQRMTKHELLLHSKSAHSSNKSPAVPKLAKSSGAPLGFLDNGSKNLPSDTSSMTRLRTPKDIDANNHESYLAKPCNITPATKAVGIQEPDRIKFTNDLDTQVSNNISFHVKHYKCDTDDQVMTKHDLKLHRTFHSLPASTSNSESAEIQSQCLKTPAMNRESLSESCQDAPTKVELDKPLSDGHNRGRVSLKKYLCPDCCFSTKYDNSLQRHHQSFHIIQHQCSECGQVMTKHDLLLHKTSHHLHASTLNSESPESRGSRAVVTTLVQPVQVDIRSPRAMAVVADNTPRKYKKRSRKFKATRRRKFLKRHLVERPVVNSFVCPTCGFTTLGNSSFVAHLSSHSEGITIKCCYCSYEAPKTRLEWLMPRHIELHRRSRLFACSKCKFSCSRADGLQKHFMRRHSKLGGKRRVKSKRVRHSGRGANQSVTNPQIGISEDLEEHDEESSEELIPPALSVKECHVVLERVEFHGPRLSVSGCESDPTKSQSAAQDSNLPFDGIKRSLECSKCSFRTKKKYLLKKHVAKHLQDFRLTCPNCGLKEMSSFNFSRHIEEHQQQGNVFKCCFCDCRPFVSRNTLAGHLNKHRPVTLVDCPKCKFSSHRTDLLNAHMKASHVKRYQCYVCGEVMSRFRLRYHLPNVHKQQLKVCRPIRMVSSGNTDQEQSENDRRWSSKSNQQMDAQTTATLGDPELMDDSAYSVGQISGKRLVNTDEGPTINHGQFVDCESMDLEPPVNQTKHGSAILQSGQSISNISQGNPKSLKSSAKCAKFAKPFLHCSNCSYKTRIKSLLKRHVAKHLIDSRFTCSKCHFKESCSLKFARHWLCHDTGPDSQKVRCCFCPIQFNRFSCYKGTLAGHLDKHRTVDLFDCSKCKFSCSNRFEFDCHSKTHTIKQACVTCGKLMTIYRLLNHADSCQSSEQIVVPSSHSTAGSEDMEIEEDLPSSTMSCKSVSIGDSSSHYMQYPGSSIQKCPELSVEGSNTTEDIDEQVLCTMCKNWLSLFDYVNHECSQFNVAMNSDDRESPIFLASDTPESLLPGLDAFPEGLELLYSNDWNIFNNGHTIEISPSDSAWLSDASAPGFPGGQQDGESMGSTAVRLGESSQTHSQPLDQMIIPIPSDSEDSYGSQCFFRGWRSE